MHGPFGGFNGSVAMADPNSRVLWWEERIKQENKAMLKLVRARRKADEAEARSVDPEREARRRELAHRLKDTKHALAEERITRYKLESEVRELEAVAKKADEYMADPIVLAKAKNAGGAVAAALK